MINDAPPTERSTEPEHYYVEVLRPTVLVPPCVANFGSVTFLVGAARTNSNRLGVSSGGQQPRSQQNEAHPPVALALKQLQLVPNPVRPIHEERDTARCPWQDL